jgi:hypothetical protein
MHRLARTLALARRDERVLLGLLLEETNLARLIRGVGEIDVLDQLGILIE